MKNTLITIPNKYRQPIFILFLLICIVFKIDPPTALFLGLVVALVIGNPFIAMNKRATTLLLQTSIVCLGFGVNLSKALQAGKQGLVFTISTIGITLIAGFLIGKWFKIDRKTSFLISNGTAICGGSAIAAVAPIIKADEHQMSVSLGTVFILNSIALFIFPMLGHVLHMTDQQFGTWCAIAIHDTSSVVGASGKFSAKAQEIATTIKLERALWIIPIALLTAYFEKSSTKKIKIPYFIFLYILAIVIAYYLPNAPIVAGKSLYEYAWMFGTKGLVVTLFLIGSGLSLNTIRQVGWRPAVQGVLLWLLIGTVSLIVIRNVV